MNHLSRLARHAFWILLLIAGVTWSYRGRLTTVDQIEPETLAQPVQTPLTNAPPIQFTRNKYEYSATPLFDYTISGLVVRRLNYGWFSIDRSEKVFPMDLCLIWGSNLRQKVHQARTIRFSQDCRWCYVQWREKLDFNLQEMSNSHLLVDRRPIEQALGKILPGDQVRLRGKLVNVSARAVGRTGGYDSESLTWNSSTTRGDTGAGACEVIYVEEVAILRPANTISRTLFRFSRWGALALAVVGVVDWFRR